MLAVSDLNRGCCARDLALELRLCSTTCLRLHCVGCCLLFRALQVERLTGRGNAASQHPTRRARSLNFPPKSRYAVTHNSETLPELRFFLIGRGSFDQRLPHKSYLDTVPIPTTWGNLRSWNYLLGGNSGYLLIHSGQLTGFLDPMHVPELSQKVPNRHLSAQECFQYKRALSSGTRGHDRLERMASKASPGVNYVHIRKPSPLAKVAPRLLMQ